MCLGAADLYIILCIGGDRIEAIRTWLLGVIGTALALNLASSLFPQGKYRAIGALVSGLILLTAILRPLLQVDWNSFSEFETSLTSELSSQQIQINEELTAVISEKTSAYIQDKGAALGIICQAQIYCQVQEGVPFPCEVWLDVPYYEALSEIISTDLNIAADHQHWQEAME